MCHKTTLASDTLIDFQIDFSISIGEIVTHWFTLIVLSALRCSDNENMLSRSSRIRRKLKDGGEDTGNHDFDDDSSDDYMSYMARDLD
ncbi:hypothetical protein Tco_0919883 [Tanacetum coccineum]